MWFKAGKSSKSEVKTRWNSIKPSKTLKNSVKPIMEATPASQETRRRRRRGRGGEIESDRSTVCARRRHFCCCCFFFASCLSFVFFFPFLFFSFLFVFFSLPFFLGSKDGRRIVGCPFSFQSIRSVAQSRFTEFYRVLPSFTEFYRVILFHFFLVLS